MPRVKRKTSNLIICDNTARFPFPEEYETVNIPRNELSTNEKQQLRKRRISQGVAAVAIIALASGAWKMSGDSGREMTKAEAGSVALDAVAARYKNMTPRQQFEWMYAGQIITGRQDMRTGGTGFRGWLARTGAESAPYSFGQDCLAGTAYDTTSSEIRGWSHGDISAVASLAIDAQGDVRVYPAGSEAPPLHFTQENNELVPGKATVRTLSANNCEPYGLKIVDEDEFHKDLLGLAAQSPFRPGQYTE